MKKEVILTNGMNLIPVVIALKNIPIKTKLTIDLFKRKYVPERYLMPKSVRYNAE